MQISALRHISHPELTFPFSKVLAGQHMFAFLFYQTKFSFSFHIFKADITSCGRSDVLRDYQRFKIIFFLSYSFILNWVCNTRTGHAPIFAEAHRRMFRNSMTTTMTSGHWPPLIRTYVPTLPRVGRYWKIYHSRTDRFPRDEISWYTP